jgi:hypothetical protein
VVFIWRILSGQQVSPVECIENCKKSVHKPNLLHSTMELQENDEIITNTTETSAVADENAALPTPRSFSSFFSHESTSSVLSDIQRSNSKELKVEDALLYLDQVSISSCRNLTSMNRSRWNLLIDRIFITNSWKL